MDIRQADLAGSWYPGDAKGCQKLFEEYEKGSKKAEAQPPPARGGVVPHAGWAFSGQLAYNVFREIQRSGAKAETVILLGKHMRSSDSPTILMADQFATPLGPVTMDKELSEKLAAQHPFTRERGRGHDQENTIELQVPFVKHLFPQARLVALGIPPREDILPLAQLIHDQAKALKRPVVVVGSTDLTHYGMGYHFAPKGHGPEALKWVKEENDPSVIRFMKALDGPGIIKDSREKHNACCAGSAALAAHYSRLSGGKAGVVVGYTTSQDVMPERAPSRFVGYVGMLL